MFNRRLLQATSGRGIPIPVDVPTACFVPSRNQYNAQNQVEYMPTFTIPENVTRLGLYWYPRSTMNTTHIADYFGKLLPWQQDSNIELITLIGLTLLVTHAGHYG